MDDCLALLRELGIRFERFDHPPVRTVAETDHYFEKMPGAHTKNLFLKNEEGTRYYLYTLDAHQRADLRALAKALGEKHLRFGSPEELQAHLGVLPGSVSLLALMHDSAHAVTLLIDHSVWRESVICCHPNTNTATLALLRTDLERFFAHTGHTPQIVG